jgi:hypothetical protein
MVAVCNQTHRSNPAICSAHSYSFEPTLRPRIAISVLKVNPLRADRSLFFLRFAAFASTFAGTRMAGFFSASATALVAPFVLLVNSRPRAALSFLCGRSTLFVA